MPLWQKEPTVGKLDWPLRYTCGHAGCLESKTYRYDTRRDLLSSFELRCYGKAGWFCLRHISPNEVLSEENLETRYEAVCEAGPYGHKFGTSGLVSGPGFKLFAEDLPVGAKLIVTARIELPVNIGGANENAQGHMKTNPPAAGRGEGDSHG
jgi:hypothetical protein